MVLYNTYRQQTKQFCILHQKTWLCNCGNKDCVHNSYSVNFSYTWIYFKLWVILIIYAHGSKQKNNCEGNIVLLFQIQLQNIVGRCFVYTHMQVLDIYSITVEAPELICCRGILFAIAFVVNPTSDPTICKKCIVITAAC